MLVYLTMMMDFDNERVGYQRRLLDCIMNGANDEAKMLLQSFENPCSLIDSSRSTLLHYAARYGNTVMVQHLIQLGCDVNVVDISGFTPLMLAVQNADATTVDVLLKNNAYVFTELSTLQLALHCSMKSPLIPGRQKYQSILEMIFAKVNESFLSHKKTITKLLLRSSELDRFAVVVFGNEELAETILSYDYPVDFKEPTRGCTALHCAIILAKVENAQLLISYNANTYAINNSGLTPLRYYTWNFEAVDANSNVLKTFLRCNPDLYLPDNNGVTQVDHLLKYGRKRTTDTVLQIGLNMVVSYGIVKNSEEEKNIAKIAVLLLQNGVDAQLVFGDGRTLVEHLMFRENIASLYVFLEHLALIGAYDEHFITERTRNTIESVSILKNTFDSFTKTFKETKNVVVHGTVTLVKLLMEGDDKLVAYARNEDLIPQFECLLEITANTDRYYFNTLHRRVSYALERVKFEKKVASIVQTMTGLHADAYHGIVYKIIGYLDLQDLNNLCRAESNHLAMD